MKCAIYITNNDTKLDVGISYSNLSIGQNIADAINLGIKFFHAMVLRYSVKYI